MYPNRLPLLPAARWRSATDGRLKGKQRKQVTLRQVR